MIELGYIGGLVAAGGDRGLVVAAVLLFRALTYVLPIPIGLVTYAIWRAKTGWRDGPVDGAEPAPETAAAR